MASYRVLIVEDHPRMGEALVEMLTQGGFRCTLARTLAAARARLRESAFEAVVVDGHLPDGEGLDLLGDADGNTPAVTVLISAMMEEHLRRRARDAGFTAACDKMRFAPEYLRAVIEGSVAVPSAAG